MATSAARTRAVAASVVSGRESAPYAGSKRLVRGGSSHGPRPRAGRLHVASCAEEQENAQESLLCSCSAVRRKSVRRVGCGALSGVASFMLRSRAGFRSLEGGNPGERHGGESRSECPGGAGKPLRGAVSLHRLVARGAQEHRAVVERHAGSGRASRAATRSPDTLEGTETP